MKEWEFLPTVLFTADPVFGKRALEAFCGMRLNLHRMFAVGQRGKASLALEGLAEIARVLEPAFTGDLAHRHMPALQKMSRPFKTHVGQVCFERHLDLFFKQRAEIMITDPPPAGDIPKRQVGFLIMLLDVIDHIMDHALLVRHVLVLEKFDEFKVRLDQHADIIREKFYRDLDLGICEADIAVFADEHKSDNVAFLQNRDKELFIAPLLALRDQRMTGILDLLQDILIEKPAG